VALLNRKRGEMENSRVESNGRLVLGKSFRRESFCLAFTTLISACLRQFCSPLFGFIGFVRAFVEFDQVVPRP
jgi:hypothetical protein